MASTSASSAAAEVVTARVELRPPMWAIPAKYGRKEDNLVVWRGSKTPYEDCEREFELAIALVCLASSLAQRDNCLASMVSPI